MKCTIHDLEVMSSNPVRLNLRCAVFFTVGKIHLHMTLIFSLHMTTSTLKSEVYFSVFTDHMHDILKNEQCQTFNGNMQVSVSIVIICYD